LKADTTALKIETENLQQGVPMPTASHTSKPEKGKDDIATGKTAKNKELPTDSDNSSGKIGSVSIKAVNELRNHYAFSISDITQTVLEIADISPAASLTYLSSEIEKEMNRHFQAYSTGAAIRRDPSPRSAVRNLVLHSTAPESLVKAVDAFWIVRNLVIHGHGAKESEIYEAIDSGLTILSSLQKIRDQRVLQDMAGIDEELKLEQDPKGEYSFIIGPVLDSSGVPGSGPFRFHVKLQYGPGEQWTATVSEIPEIFGVGTSEEEAKQDLISSIKNKMPALLLELT
jgi:hypothetical protein